MAIEVNLEKYGHKKKGFLGFSWTAFFFNFFVPLFRLDFLGFFIFISPYLIIAIIILFTIITGINNENAIFALIIICSILKFISRFVFPFIYNKFYTKGLIKEGYLPPKDDEYSNAILKGHKFLGYTEEELLDKEKMERYIEIFEEYKKERTKDFINFILTAILLILLIAILFYI